MIKHIEFQFCFFFVMDLLRIKIKTSLTSQTTIHDRNNAGRLSTLFRWLNLIQFDPLHRIIAKKGKNDGRYKFLIDDDCGLDKFHLGHTHTHIQFKLTIKFFLLFYSWISFLKFYGCISKCKLRTFLYHLHTNDKENTNWSTV